MVLPDLETLLLRLSPGQRRALAQPGVEDALLALLGGMQMDLESGASSLLEESQTQQESINKTLFSAFEAAWDGMAILNAEQRYVYLNEAHLRTYGYERLEELQGKSWRMLYGADELRRFDEEIIPLLQESGWWRGEAVGRRCDGTSFDQELTLLRAGDTNLICVVKDISSRKEAERALRESETKYRKLFDLAPEAIVVFDPQTEKVFEANPRACELYGLSKEELLKKSLKEFTVDVPRGEQQLYSILYKGPQSNFETTHFSKDGRNTLLLVNSVSIEYRGRPAILSFLRDVTELKKAETERARLFAAVEQATETVVITDAAGVIQYANPSFERTSGYTPDEALGKNPSFLKSGKQDGAFYRSMWETLKKGLPWQGHFVNRRKGGGLYEEEASISPVKDANGVIMGYVGVKRDVTAELAQAARLQHADKLAALGEFMSNYAHRVKNFLYALSINLAVSKRSIEKDPPDMENAKAYLGISIGELEKLIRFNRETLGYSRRENLRIERFNVNKLAEEVYDQTRLKLEGCGIELGMQLSTVSPVNGDYRALKDGLVNLVTNAQDAMPVGGRMIIRTDVIKIEVGDVEATTVPPGVYVRLCVQDTGDGIEEAVVPHIFEPFYTTKESGKGTGLGLAQVWSTMHQLGGGIDVDTERGKGATFRLYLPALAESVGTGEG